MKKLLTYLFCFFVIGFHAQVFTVTLTTTAAACQKGSGKFVVTGGTGPKTITWSNGFVGSYQADLDTGLYSVTIADSIGNDSVFLVYIEAKECPIQVVNIFSPNGDGIRDTWGATNTKYHEGDYIVQVFNRWGQKVFEKRNESEPTPWDGRSFGSPCPDGTYYYIIEYTDQYHGEKKAHGAVTILR